MLAFLAICALLPLATASGQSAGAASPQAPSWLDQVRSQGIHVKNWPLHLDRTLEVRIEGLTGEWTVGLHPDAKLPPFASVADIRLEPVGPVFRKMAAIEFRDEKDLEITHGVVWLHPRGAPQDALMAYLRVPPETTVSVYFDGRSVFSSRLTADLILRNGTVFEEKIPTLGALLPWVSRPASLKPAATDRLIIANPDGTYSASSKVMTDHFISSNPLCEPPLSVGPPGIFTLRFKVAPSGEVQEVTPIGEFRRLDEPCMATLRAWRFQPFVISGSPVAVTGVMPLILEANPRRLRPRTSQNP